MPKNKKHAASLASSLFAVLVVPAAFAATYYASPDGAGTGASPSDPCSISDGFAKIKSAAHTLVLAKGRYVLSGALSLPAVKSTTEQTVVMGETGNPADVILDAHGASEIMRTDFSCLVTGVTMLNGSNAGFNSQSAYANSAGGVRISYTDNVYGPSIVSNCVIVCCTNNFNSNYKFNSGALNGKVAYGSAVHVMNNGLLVDSTVASNSAPRYYSGGVLLSSNATVRGCAIIGNAAVNGGAGVFCNWNSTASIEGGVVSNNTVTGSTGTGGGIDCRADGSVLTVRRCTIAGNTAALGAGLDAVGDVDVTCTSCDFIGNTATGQGGGVRLATTATVRLDGCTLDGNKTTGNQWTIDGKPSADYAGGGGVFVQTQSGDGFVSVSNCTFRGNVSQSRGGGFGHTWGDAVYGEIVNCVFTNNSSYRQGGGLLLREETARTDRPFLIRNCLFAFNKTTAGSSVDTSGAGLCFVLRGNPILDSCTIVSNDSGRASSSGGLHHRYGGTVTNCVIAFNTRAGAAETGTGWCLVDPDNTSVLVPSAYVNSCAWPAADGAFLAANGCVNANPQFRDAAHGDFTLKAASPCRDAGVSESWMTGAVDLAGRQRVRGRYVDMGAYEYFPCGCLFMFW